MIESDATVFKFQPDHKVFFMFHPFYAVVMEAALKNVRESVESNPREAWLIYNTPDCYKTFLQSRAFTAWERKDY